LMAAILFLAVGTSAGTTNALSDAEIQGRNLVRQLLEQPPADNSTNTGVLKIRDAKKNRLEIPVTCVVRVTATNWLSIYEATFSNRVEALLVVHAAGRPNQYFYNPQIGNPDLLSGSLSAPEQLFPDGERDRTGTMVPFAGSDFWIADLGLEFFHWPGQKIVKKEFRRNCGCSVLESTNPAPATNAYSRVLAWIDNETGGIVQAEAYDSANRLFKEFYPKKIKKVNRQWVVETLDLRNVQTGSRTRLEFGAGKE